MPIHRKAHMHTQTHITTVKKGELNQFASSIWKL